MRRSIQLTYDVYKGVVEGRSLVTSGPERTAASIDLKAPVVEPSIYHGPYPRSLILEDSTSVAEPVLPGRHAVARQIVGVNSIPSSTYCVGSERAAKLSSQSIMLARRKSVARLADVLPRRTSPH